MSDIKQWILGLTIAAVGVFAALTASPQGTQAHDPLPHTGIISEIPMPAKIQKYVEDVCTINDIDPLLVLAIIERESGYQPNEVNSLTGCAGLMQLSPDTLEWLYTQTGCKYDPFDPYQNIAGGVYLLRWLLNWYDNDLPKALLAYAQGIGTATNMLKDGVNPLYRWEYTTAIEIRDKLAAMQKPKRVLVSVRIKQTTGSFTGC